MPRAGSSSVKIIGAIIPTLSEPPESIAGLILSTPDLFGSDEDYDPNETTSDDGRSKTSGDDTTGSSDTGSLAGTAVPVRISFPEREDVAPQLAIRRLFAGASKRDSLLMNTSYIVALDLHFREAEVILGDPARVTEFLQSCLDAAAKLSASSTSPPAFSIESASQFIAPSYIIHVANLHVHVYSSRENADPLLLYAEPFRFLSAALKHCLHFFMKWNSVPSRKALVDLLKSGKLSISIEGARRETRVAQLIVYFLLGFNPERDTPIDAITVDVDESIPSSYDPRVVMREFKALDDSTSVAARLQKVLRRAAVHPSTSSSNIAPLVPLKRLFTAQPEFGDGEEYFGDAIDDLSLISGGYTFALRDLTHLKMAFFGAPSVGKSTLINCLLGQSLVYTSIKESTGAPTEIVGTPAHMTPAVVKSVEDAATIPSHAIAEVTFISEEDFKNIVTPIEREVEHAKSELDFLTHSPAEELGMPDSERDARISKMEGHVAQFQQRRTDYLALFEKYKGQRNLFITSKEDLQQYIKIEDKKSEVSLADIVSRVRLFMPGIPLLEHITIVDTPGWNIDSKTFAEDFRLQRSQVEVADVDAWVYLTSAYEFDSLGDNVKMIKSLTKDQAPGLLTITCFDMAKDQKEKGFNYCVGQKLDSVGVYYEGSGQTGAKDFTPITCAKVYADYLEVLRLKEEISNWTQKTSPSATPTSPTSPASTIVNARNNLRKKWRTFLDYLNSVLDFILKDELNVVTDADETPEDETADIADDLLDLDAGKPAQAPLSSRIEAFVKFVAGASTMETPAPGSPFTRRTLKSYNSMAITKDMPHPTRPTSKGSSLDLRSAASTSAKDKEKEDDVVGDLAVEISGLPHLFSRISTQLQPRIGKILSARYSKMDQTARVVLSNLFKDILKLQHEIKTSVTRKQIASRLTRARDAKLAEIALLERNMESFRRIVRKSRSRLEVHINLVIQIILQTCDFTILLDGQRGRKNAARKKKGLDLFFIRREMISLHDYFDSAARGAAHHAIATVMNHIASQHMKLFSSLELVSPIDYSKLSDADHWLDEAQCVTVGDHEVELRGSDRDGKAVRDWLKRAQRSCEKERDRVLDASMKHFDSWSQRILDEQRESADNFNKKRNKQIKQSERDLRKASSEEIDPDRVKSLQTKLSKKTDHIERLFRTYTTDIFSNTVKYYM